MQSELKSHLWILEDVGQFAFAAGVNPSLSNRFGVRWPVWVKLFAASLIYVASQAS